jgi:hypothetical protein
MRAHLFLVDGPRQSCDHDGVENKKTLLTTHDTGCFPRNDLGTHSSETRCRCRRGRLDARDCCCSRSVGRHIPYRKRRRGCSSVECRFGGRLEDQGSFFLDCLAEHGSCHVRGRVVAAMWWWNVGRPRKIVDWIDKMSRGGGG